ncbi:hypothetical protein FDI40_gp640 [Agrobacterium phage Atu_ph07]|uniref:Uncharacterized protein n=1 Tax=Agrobacterium phage Atu_ph07 TaxID=2024264 RepID=A0A2L0V0T9_9CAUD|nr:hypothetical protein FDI40_gp640 [Agrobacterium phage Atu_ph07]AUZ95399.1 hypothetical protein [Agrobacterium phage Atu_ph07]
MFDVREYKNQSDNRTWAYDVDSYYRWKRMVDLAEKVGSVNTLMFAKKQIADIEAKYPTVKF